MAEKSEEMIMAGGRVEIYGTDGGFVVADAGGWLPGVYETEAAAEQAAKIDIETLERLVGKDGEIIRMIDLQDKIAGS